MRFPWIQVTWHDNAPLLVFSNAESTNNRIKAKKLRKASGFLGTIELIRSIDAEKQDDFALAVVGLHEDLQLRKEFAKFKRPDFLELSSREREKFLSRLPNTSLSKLLSEDLSTLLSGNSINPSRNSSSTSLKLNKQVHNHNLHCISSKRWRLLMMTQGSVAFQPLLGKEL